MQPSNLVVVKATLQEYREIFGCYMQAHVQHVAVVPADDIDTRSKKAQTFARREAGFCQLSQ